MTYSTRPRLKTKPVDWTPYIGVEIPISGNFWTNQGHKIIGIIAYELEDRTDTRITGVLEVRSLTQGSVDLILGDGTRTKSIRSFWIKDGVAIATNFDGLFTKSTVSMSIVDSIVECLKYNNKWIIPSEINKYRNIEIDSDLGRILLEPCLAEFGSLDALKDASVITEAKKIKSTSTGSVGWGHRSMD